MSQLALGVALASIVGAIVVPKPWQAALCVALAFAAMLSVP